MKSIEKQPGAERTFDAVTRFGYDLNSSLADVLDNSITPSKQSKNIDVAFKHKNGRFYCRIVDDGIGMSPEKLEEAMRIGAEVDYEEGDLGKFGFGMKTASLTHCEVLTVLSKRANGEIAGYRWDLAHVKKTKKWSLLEFERKDIKDLLRHEKFSFGAHGTLVMWDNMKSHDYEYSRYENTKLAENYYYRILGDLKLHLRMVFHRFLEKGAVKLTVNGERLTAWDPFCRGEKATIKVDLKPELSRLHIPGYRTPIKIDAYVVPTKEAFSSVAAWNAGKGLLSWNDSQGYYIYRADRLIRFGGWQGTKAKDEHDKLARVSIDIDASLDKLFKVTVDKNNIRLPEALFNHLKYELNPAVIRKAKAQYNKSGEKTKIRNKFRDEMPQIGRDLIEGSGVSITCGKGESKDISVKNPSGEWISNKLNEFLKHPGSNDFEIVSGKIDGNHLWRVVGNDKGKFKVVVNAKHPFYSKIYTTAQGKLLGKIVDALILSLAWSELYNKNDANALLLETYKSNFSMTLERLVKGNFI